MSVLSWVKCEMPTGTGIHTAPGTTVRGYIVDIEFFRMHLDTLTLNINFRKKKIRFENDHCNFRQKKIHFERKIRGKDVWRNYYFLMKYAAVTGPRYPAVSSACT